MSDAFNLYELLELDPDAPWSQPAFEQRLKEKQRKWVAEENNPRTGRAAKQKREQVPDVRLVAADAARRAEHADEARTKRHSQLSEQRHELATDLELFQARGFLLEGELNGLVTRYAAVASAAEIRAKVRVPVRAAAAASRKADVIDSMVVEKMDRALRLLGKRNLYDFLELGEGTAPKELQARVQEKYKDVQQTSNKTAEVDAMSDLVGICMAHLKTTEGKDRYDRTLQEQHYDALRAKLDQLGAQSKSISAAQIDLLLRDLRAGRTHTNVDAALEVIRQHATGKGFALEIAQQAIEQARRLQQCGYCGATSDAGAAHCTTCGEALVEPCPRCANSLPTDQHACAACGFPAGNRLLVKELIVHAREAFERRDHAEASDLVRRAAEAWPAVTQGSLVQQRTALGASVSQALAEQTAARAQLQEALAQRRLYAARDLLQRAMALQPAGSTSLDRQAREIEAGVAAAQAKLRAIPARGGNDAEDQASRFEEVLQIAADCREAIDGLARTPPSPPRELEAHVVGQGVHLAWRPSASRAVAYAILRKAWSRPASAADGMVLATVSGCSFDDTAPDPGVPVFYGVFADRHGVHSREGALLRAPLQVLKEAEQIVARVDHRRVAITWSPPRHALAVLVQRSDATHPRSPAEGRRIQAIGANQAVDTDVENDRKYFYTVFAQFKGPDGAVLTTPGTHLEAVPQEPPEPVRDLRVMAEGGAADRRLRLKCTVPKRGNLVVFRSNASFASQCGTVVPRAALAVHGSPLEMRGADAVDRVATPGPWYYLPVVVFHDSAYLGQEVRHVSVDEAEDLEAQNFGHLIRLHWRWPPGCNEALVLHRTDAWPQHGAPGTTCICVSRAQYDARGHFDIESPAHADHHVAICTVYGHGSERVVAAGNCRVKLAVRSRIDVSYEIMKPILSRSLRLSLTTAGEGTLPAMVLVRKQGALPSTRVDGEAIFSIPARTASARPETIELPSTVVKSQSFGLLFLQDDAGYDYVTIRKPAKEKLRLF